MNTSHPCTVIPTELALLEFFESEPVEARPQDGYWCYEVSDKLGVYVRLSFNILEKSVQCSLSLKGNNLETVVHEGAEELRIVDDAIHGRFCLGNTSYLELRLRPFICVQWSSLQQF